MTLREQLALVVHDWHCPDEIGVDNLYWTGPRWQDYLDCADQILALRLVQLAEDQTPAGITPDKDTKLEGEEYRRGVWAGYNLAINDHKIEGWRKVILEEH